MAQLHITTWNVLSDAYISSERYPTAEVPLLRRGARTALVAEQVAGFDADVICLQEADEALVAALRQRLGGRYDIIWAAKGAGRPDGMVTVIRRPWTATSTVRRRYDRGVLSGRGQVSLHTQLTCGSVTVTVTNSHVLWMAPGTRPALHAGTAEVAALLNDVADVEQLVMVGDFNDHEGGPARSLLATGRLVEAHPATPSAWVMGRPVALDVIAGRGCSLVAGSSPEPSPTFPDRTCPSDHVPLCAVATFS